MFFLLKILFSTREQCDGVFLPQSFAGENDAEWSSDDEEDTAKYKEAAAASCESGDGEVLKGALLVFSDLLFVFHSSLTKNGILTSFSRRLKMLLPNWGAEFSRS